MSDISKELEDWGIKHLYGKFTFKPMWLDAKKELKQLIDKAYKEGFDDGLDECGEGPSQ